MKSNTVKFAVSALALGATMVACKPAAQASRISSASAKQGSMRQAIVFYAKANAAAKTGDYAGALEFAEKAVEESPMDLGFRMLLADLYLKNGRFQSAETTFEDVLALDRTNVRAGLSVALARVALGRTGGAIAQLDEMNGAPPADLGLAYALAGELRRAIEILEPAARSPGADARVRQNLALAYAFAGDWQKARTTAAQDVSPDQLAARMEQWATLAQPKSAHHQVAGLLGVTPAADPGQPAGLALAPAHPRAPALAAAEPAPVAAPAPAPVQLAAVSAPAAVGGPAPVEAAPVEMASFEPTPAEPAPAPMPVWVSAPEAHVSIDAPAAPAAPFEEAEEAKPVYAAAVESLIAPKATVFNASGPTLPAAKPFRTASAPRAKAAVQKAVLTSSSGTGRFAVQLGAFSSASGVERAWAQAHKRFGFAERTPLTTTVKLPKGTFHRLSVAGFGSHGEAARVCQTVKAKGGVCFVRAIAGDAPTQWASRYTRARRG
jgi:Flp pilus assembly protein TadD